MCFFSSNMMLSHKSDDTDSNAEIKIQLTPFTQDFYVSSQIIHLSVSLYFIYRMGIMVHMLSDFSVQSV